MTTQTRIIQGDVVRFCKHHKVLGLPKFHALLCDAPYGLSFMGKDWDSIDGVAFDPETWRAIADTLLPGAYLFVFAGNLNDDLISVAMRRAGLVKQHKALAWSQGSSLPKTTRIDTRIDADAGMEREIIGKNPNARRNEGTWRLDGFHTRGELESAATINAKTPYGRNARKTLDRLNAHTESRKFENITAPATELARTWAGHRYGAQALRNLVEAILIFRKPYEGRPVDSITRYGSGTYNIAGSRIGHNESEGKPHNGMAGKSGGIMGKTVMRHRDTTAADTSGRHPANFLITHTTYPVFRLDDTQPLGVTAYIRGYFDGYDRVTEVRKARGVADAQADAVTLEVIAQDIPQPWLEYFIQTKEDLGCVRRGTKRVRGSAMSHSSNSSGGQGIYSEREGYEKHDGYADADGLEVVSDFDCARDESGRFVCPVALLDEQAGERGGGDNREGGKGSRPAGFGNVGANNGTKEPVGKLYNDTGGPSRFVVTADWSHEQHYADATSQRIEDANAVRYQAKPSKVERDAGLRGHFPCVECSEYNTASHMVAVGDKQEARPCRRSVHPTRKPIKMMQYLCTLLSVPDTYAPRRLFVPFCGEGSEVSGAILSGAWEEIIGVDSEPAYVDRARVAAAYWQDEIQYGQTNPAVILKTSHQPAPSKAGDVQLSMFDIKKTS